MCEKCRLKLPLILSPFCKRCGQSLPKTLFHGKALNPNVCPACRTRHFPFSMSRSVMIYDEDTAPLILKLKYGDHGELASVFADLCVLTHFDIFKNIDMIIPVPLSIKRLLTRKYNQAALIGLEISKKIDVPMRTNLLKRKKFAGFQGGRSFKERQENVRDAFAISPLKKSGLEGKILLLVDDVMASGATILSCAKVLKESGAKEVRVLTLARSI